MGGGGGGSYNRTKKAFQNKLHSSAGQNTFCIYSFQYKLEVGGGLISEGFTLLDPEEWPGSLLFLDQTKARGAEKIFLGDRGPPLYKGLDDRPRPSFISRSGSGTGL